MLLQIALFGGTWVKTMKTDGEGGMKEERKEDGAQIWDAGYGCKGKRKECEGV